MASHPYISGPGSVMQMIGFLRKNFPARVTSDTVKKFALAPNNESYVINALQFIGVIDEEGKRTSKAHDIFVLGDDVFPKAFEGLIKEAYSDLFDLRGDDTWALGRSDLVSYFRTTDKTSEVIGGRQAGLFETFRALAGHERPNERASANGLSKPKSARLKAVTQKKAKAADVKVKQAANLAPEGKESRRDMAMTVRVEINLPANGSQETYDAIFKSIRANLIDD
ncbi:DUF5343 domain-containing protein [Allosphingosinicella humi]